MTLRRCLPLVLFVLLIALTIVPHAPTLASVEIKSFRAQGQVGQVVVMWTMANEDNNLGFNLWRDTSVNFSGRPTHLNNGQLIPSQCVNCVAETDYVYTDTDVASGTYYYKLESVDVYSATESFGPASADVIATPAVAMLPPTHTPVPSYTPTPTDTPVHTATATRPTYTPTPTGTPQPETPAASEPTATATQSVQATMPNATATLATPLPPSPTPTLPLEPERTSTPFVLTVVALTAAPSPTAARSTATLAAPTATPKKSGASISTPTRPARMLSPVAETPQVELWRILIGVGLIGLGAVLGLSVLGIVVYFLWRRPSRP